MKSQTKGADRPRDHSIGLAASATKASCVRLTPETAMDRIEARTSAATKLQAAFRTFAVLRENARRLEAAVAIQRCYRRSSAAARAKRALENARRQRRIRKHEVEVKYLKNLPSDLFENYKTVKRAHAAGSHPESVAMEEGRAAPRTGRAPGAGIVVRRGSLHLGGRDRGLREGGQDADELHRVLGPFAPGAESGPAERDKGQGRDLRGLGVRHHGVLEGRRGGGQEGSERVPRGIGSLFRTSHG